MVFNFNYSKTVVNFHKGLHSTQWSSYLRDVWTNAVGHSSISCIQNVTYCAQYAYHKFMCGGMNAGSVMLTEKSSQLLTLIRHFKHV